MSMYVYRRAGSDGARALADVLGARRWRDQRTPLAQKARSGDVVVSWGEAVTGLPTGVRVLNGAPLQNKFTQAQALMAAAHTLKGSLLVLSADRASTAALELEKLGRQSKLQGAADWFAILESEVHAVSSELHKIVKERLTTAVRH